MYDDFLVSSLYVRNIKTYILRHNEVKKVYTQKVEKASKTNGVS